MPSKTDEPIDDNLIPNQEIRCQMVWASNLDDRFRHFQTLVQHCQYVSFDIIYPGCVARPIGEFRSTFDYLYQVMRCNVEILKPIQLELTLFDRAGRPVDDEYPTWKFNFEFSLSRDMYAQQSVNELIDKGVDFDRHELDGVEPNRFAELLIGSGSVLTDRVKWISYAGLIGYGFLLKMLTDQRLPYCYTSFFESLEMYFPIIYDVYYMMVKRQTLGHSFTDTNNPYLTEELCNPWSCPNQCGRQRYRCKSLQIGEAFFQLRDNLF